MLIVGAQYLVLPWHFQRIFLRRMLVLKTTAESRTIVGLVSLKVSKYSLSSRTSPSLKNSGALSGALTCCTILQTLPNWKWKTARSLLTILTQFPIPPNSRTSSCSHRLASDYSFMNSNSKSCNCLLPSQIKMGGTSMWGWILGGKQT